MNSLETIIEKNGRTPTVLNERVLLKDKHRSILNAINELFPEDTGYLYVHDPRSTDVPTLDDLSEKIGITNGRLRNTLLKIGEIWNLPEDLPTGKGKISEDQALMLALCNQHRLRYDSEMDDYRVPRIFMLNAELGTGTLYTRNKAFEGERIFRASLNINEMLNAYIIQGGVMPQIMSLYGKLKTERASLTGLDKSGSTYTKEDLRELRTYLELAQRDPVTGKSGRLKEKEIKNLEEFVLNTLNTMPVAAESVAYELAPLFEDIPEEVPIHIFFSYNDDFNMDEIGDLLISSMRLVRQKAEAAEVRIPMLKEDLVKYQNSYAQSIVNVAVADHILDYFAEYEGDVPKGKKLRTTIEDKLFNDNGDRWSGGLRKLKATLEKQYMGQAPNSTPEDFEISFEDAKKRFYGVTAITNTEIIESRFDVDKRKKTKFRNRISMTKQDISEYETYAKAYEAEKFEGHSWFTKKIAVNSTESKAMRMVKKENYRKVYEKFMFTKLEEILGYMPNIKLHTDREMSIHVPEPSKLYKKGKTLDDILDGTIITSIPRVNRQLSNEPTGNSMIKLQKKHEASLSARVENKGERPKTVGEFDKHHSLAYSDIVLTSWGTEGFQILPKITVAPTRVKGEYRNEVEIVYYVKIPTRHNTAVLSELGKKGNRGTWEIKRLEKGQPTTGNILHIIHSDKSHSSVFIGDSFYEHIADKYSECISNIESKLDNARVRHSKERWRNELGKVYEEIREEAQLYNVLLTNDTHFGAHNLKGRPTNTDVIRSSQLVAMQTYGFDDIHVSVGTEFLHGKQQWRAYDSSLEGELEDPVTSDSLTEMLTRGLRQLFLENGIEGEELEQKISFYLNAYKSEQMHSRSTFRPDDQVDMFKMMQQPLWEDLMNNKIPITIGSGNHWKSSIKDIDEATLIKNLFDTRYEWEGLMNALPAHGGSYTFKPFALPSNGTVINGVLTHKMWHGNTEISNLSRQALGNKENATVYLVADRHQPGVVLEHGKYFVLDTGKQTTMPYVSIIGKASSTRGTLVTSYSPKGHQLYATRFFLDNVVDQVIGWGNRSEVLRTCYEITEERKEKYSQDSMN